MVRLCRPGWIVRALRSLVGPALLAAALAVPTPPALGQQPQEIGRWDPVNASAGSQDNYGWLPGFTMHFVRLPGGKALAWYQAAEPPVCPFPCCEPPGCPCGPHEQPHLWDPGAAPGNQFTILEANLPLGCSGHAQVLPNTLLIAGGGDPNTCCYPSVDNATKFASTSGGWVPVSPMAWPRW